MKFIDSHAHLYESAYKHDIDAVINRALRVGVEKIIIQNVDSTTIEPMMELCNNYKEVCLPTMGLHPCSVKANYEEELNLVTQNWQINKYTAVAEIGLDYYWDKSYVAEQQKAFRHQLAIAQHYNVPVCIHSRDSFADCIKIMKEENKGSLKGVLHCFGGSYEEASQALNMGFYLGIGGVVTYKNTKLPEVLAKIGLSNLILETDAPYLSPVPYRGKRNESSYLREIGNVIAQALNLSLMQVAQQTTYNAQQLFSL
jgi:TatD DNase family protein